MALDAKLKILKPLRRFLTEAGKQVERKLRVEDLFRQPFERKQIDRLLLQLVEPLFSTLAGGLEYMRYRALNRVQGMQAIQNERQGDGCRGGDHVDCVGRDDVTGGLRHRGPQARARTLFAGIRQIY